MTNGLRDIDRHILGEIWTSDGIYRNLRYLCDDLGHRFGGSASEHAGAEFLAEKMREYGLQNVQLEEFPMYGWERGECFLAMTAPVERSFSAISMPYTGSATLEGDLYDVGEGEEADFDRHSGQFAGKIVLTDAETNRPGQTRYHRTDKYRRAIDGGASGVIFINRNPGLLHITGALYAKVPGSPNVVDHEAPIPGIGVTFEAGSMIRRLAERGTASMRMRVKNSTYLSKSYNPIGDIPGGESADEVVLFGGHYDGHDISQGAGDDAAGTLVGVEAGRALAPFAGKLKRSIRIICFGCEEIGLLGAWHHVERYADGDDKLRFVMNLDGAGRGTGGAEQVVATGDTSQIPYFERLGEEMHYQFPVSSNISVHSDHFPFYLAGYPSATLRSSDSTAGMIGRGYGHTEGDTVDKVHLRGLQMSSILAARLAVRIANADEVPGETRSADEIRQQLEEREMSHFLDHHWGRANRAE